MSFRLTSAGLEYEIRVLEISSLHFHEEVSKDILDEVTSSFRKTGIFRDPVAVDRESRVVLDGTHRVSSLKKLGYDKVPVFFVNYKRDEIMVESWARLFRGIDLDRLLTICRNVGFQPSRWSHFKVLKLMLEDRSLELVAVSEKEGFMLYPDFGSLLEVYESLVSVEDVLKEEDFAPAFVDEKTVLSELGASEVALLVPPPEKQDVIDVGLSDSVFPYKISRHIIPGRPVGIDFSLSALEGSVESVEEELSENLRKRETEYLNSGQEYRDLKNNEGLFVFR